MTEDDLARRIEAFGERLDLSSYEIEAYLAVLERGSISASTLADQTGIPQPRIYDTVRSLNDRGLVELHESRPMTVVAVDPAEAFAGVEDVFDRMLAALQRRYNAPEHDQEAVSLVKSRSTILRHLGAVIDRSEFDLALSLTPELLTRYTDELREAKARGVSIELLVTPASRAPDADRFPYTDLASTVRKRRGVTTPVIAVADGEHSVYATQDAFRDDEERYAVIFNRSSLGFLVFGFFGTVLWTTADPVTDAAFEKTFPQRYASIRRCIKDIRSLDGPFAATVEGRRVETGESCRVSGEITDLAIETTGEIASMTLDTPGGELSVGGRLAALEDIEAHDIVVERP